MQPPTTATVFSKPLVPAAAASAHAFPARTNPKPCRIHLRLRLRLSTAATSRWVNPRVPPRRGAANDRLHHFIRLGDLDAALQLVGSMSEPPAVVPCTLLIKKLCAAGRLADAEGVLRASEAAGNADAVDHNTLVAGYCRAGRLEMVLSY